MFGEKLAFFSQKTYVMITFLQKLAVVKAKTPFLPSFLGEYILKIKNPRMHGVNLRLFGIAYPSAKKLAI
jgi:hypothetical protein